MEKTKIIFDCDTGHDDAIALMVASKMPELEILGVTTVNGNAPLENTFVNTMNVCQRLGLSHRVYAGCDRPLVRDKYNATKVHGKTGLDGPVFEPLNREIETKHAVEFIIETLMAAEEPITIVAVGPLTNIALAMRLKPAIIEKIARISIMGGAFGFGNSTPSAEFNIFADPEAAHIVFGSGVHIDQFGLDITTQTKASLQIIERMEALNNKASKLFSELMRFVYNSNLKANKDDGGFPVHDVLAVVYVVHPEIFVMRDAGVDVDITHGPSYGRTNCDFLGKTNVPVNTSVGQTLDEAKFWDIVESAMKLYD